MAEDAPIDNPARFILGVQNVQVDVETELIRRHVGELNRQYRELGYLSFFGKHYVPEFVIEGVEFARDIFTLVYDTTIRKNSSNR